MKMITASVARAPAAALTQRPVAAATAAVATAVIRPTTVMFLRRTSAMRWMWPSSWVSVRSSTAAMAGRRTIAPKTSVPQMTPLARIARPARIFDEGAHQGPVGWVSMG